MCFRNFPDGWLCDIWFLSSAWAVTTSSFSHLFSDFALNREGFSLVAEAYLRLDFPVIPQWQAYISNRDRVLLRLNFLKNKKTKQSKKNPVNSWHFITPPLVKKKKKSTVCICSSTTFKRAPCWRPEVCGCTASLGLPAASHHFLLILDVHCILPTQ